MLSVETTDAGRVHAVQVSLGKAGNEGREADKQVHMVWMFQGRFISPIWYHLAHAAEQDSHNLRDLARGFWIGSGLRCGTCTKPLTTESDELEQTIDSK